MYIEEWEKNTYQEQEPSIKNHVSRKIWESGSI